MSPGCSPAPAPQPRPSVSAGVDAGGPLSRTPVLPPYLCQVEVEKTERGELEAGGEAVEQPVREEVQARGRPQQGQRAAEGEGGREERGPERCPRETQEEAEALVTEAPLAEQQQPPQLQVGKGEERGVEQRVQHAQR